VASSWTDAAGNPGFASNTLSITEDTKSPTVTVTGSSPTLKAGQTDTITFTFSEAVTGFDNNDVSVTNGQLSLITKVDDTHYTAVFTPTGGADTQTATIQVVASGSGTTSGTDTLGNPGLARHTLSTTEASKGPTVPVTGTPPPYTALFPSTITFTFSEAVTGFDNADVSVTGGTLSTITQVDATTYTAVFTPAAGVDTQTATVQVVA